MLQPADESGCGVGAAGGRPLQPAAGRQAGQAAHRLLLQGGLRRWQAETEDLRRLHPRPVLRASGQLISP